MALGDSTRINTNLGAYQALRALQDIGAQLSATQRRLSTGKRINEAGDDPAGFSVAQKFDTRARGLATALDGVATFGNVLSVANGGIQNINDILLQIRDLVVQATSDNLGTDERNAIEQQTDDLSAEITRLRDQTTFAGQSLLNGSFVGRRVTTGSEAAEFILLSITQDFSLASLGIVDASIDVTTSALASATLVRVDSALSTVRTQNQTVGSVANRLLTVQDAISVAITNTTAAKARILDADVAAEQVNAVRLQILQQLATAQLAQSNLQPQSILALFQ